MLAEKAEKSKGGSKNNSPKATPMDENRGTEEVSPLMNEVKVM
jgi:hypothetical protein